MSYAGENHCNIVFVGRSDRFVIADRAAGLNHGCRAPPHSLKQSISEREKSI
jgi:hypothetical protein